jgi:hypothetical protein
LAVGSQVPSLQLALCDARKVGHRAIVSPGPDAIEADSLKPQTGAVVDG